MVTTCRSSIAHRDLQVSDRDLQDFHRDLQVFAPSNLDDCIYMYWYYSCYDTVQ